MGAKTEVILPQVLRDRRDIVLMSIRIFCQILLPFPCSNFAQNLISSIFSGTDYLPQILSKSVQHFCKMNKIMPMLAWDNGTDNATLLCMVCCGHKDMSQVVFLRLTKTNLNTSTDIRTDMKLEYDMSSRSEESHLSETVVKNLYH